MDWFSRANLQGLPRTDIFTYDLEILTRITSVRTLTTPIGGTQLGSFQTKIFPLRIVSILVLETLSSKNSKKTRFEEASPESRCSDTTCYVTQIIYNINIGNKKINSLILSHFEGENSFYIRSINNFWMIQITKPPQYI